ncbi:hypothetical protein D7U91_01370 [Stenotrophomonas maltophilia]|nr:hypothetical protein [Stenotrophomonas maltophilia]MBA0391872.1 hypothetical protein [Stenotrophomonas maltophilia]MBA0464316.1 hypothetical protein [Stenotrophomonas maltophilia]MBA0471694.1 hypothetical protein [Stenotrophomonas maltophilia]
MTLDCLRQAALAGLLREAGVSDSDALYPLLARVLGTHMDSGHDNPLANACIRDDLDQLELLLALEIERHGLRMQSKAPTCADTTAHQRIG